MNRLDTELHRLFLPSQAAPGAAAGARPESVAPSVQTQGTRALMLTVSGPAPWGALGRVWRGVQTELEWPAPAIAVNGQDGCALWFPLAQPVSPAEGRALLGGLQRRYLTELAPARVGLGTQPSHASAGAGGRDEAEPHRLPPHEVAPGRWSAFVAPDLAALFDEEPWLDLAPPADAQAELLSRIQCVRPDDWHRGLERLGVGSAPTPAAAAPSAGTERASAGPGPMLDPRGFLLAVMNDPGVDLKLRIEAAKALLPSASGV